MTSLYLFMNIIHSMLHLDQPMSLFLLQNNFPSCSLLLPIWVLLTFTNIEEFTKSPSTLEFL